MTGGNPQTVEGWLQIPPECGLLKPRRGVWRGQGERRQKTGSGQVNHLKEQGMRLKKRFRMIKLNSG
jgi:hypothetical protein